MRNFERRMWQHYSQTLIIFLGCKRIWDLSFSQKGPLFSWVAMEIFQYSCSGPAAPLGQPVTWWLARCSTPSDGTRRGHHSAGRSNVLGGRGNDSSDLQLRSTHRETSLLTSTQMKLNHIHLFLCFLPTREGLHHLLLICAAWIHWNSYWRMFFNLFQWSCRLLHLSLPLKRRGWCSWSMLQERSRLQSDLLPGLYALKWEREAQAAKGRLLHRAKALGSTNHPKCEVCGFLKLLFQGGQQRMILQQLPTAIPCMKETLFPHKAPFWGQNAAQTNLQCRAVPSQQAAFY